MYYEDLDGPVSSRLYDTLKWLGLIGCYLLALILGICGSAWGLSDPTHSMLIVNIVGLSIGLILAFNQALVTSEEENKENPSK